MADPVLSFNSGHQQKCSQSCSSLISPRITSAQLLPPVETSLAKNLSDTLLAAVAVLIGSAIAAAFKTPFNAALFRVGVIAYAGYVLVFPGLYGLGSQVGQFLEIGRTFEHERKRFNTLLNPEKTNQIVENRVTSAKTRYWRWFGFTVVGYAIAMAGAMVAAIVVPSIVG